VSLGIHFGGDANVDVRHLLTGHLSEHRLRPIKEIAYRELECFHPSMIAGTQTASTPSAYAPRRSNNA